MFDLSRSTLAILITAALVLPSASRAEYDGKAVLYNNRGVDMINRGAPEDAIESFQKAIEIDPAYPDPYLNLATTYYESGKSASAVEYLQKAVQVKENYAEAHFLLGAVYAKENKSDQAIAEYEKAIKYKATLPGPYYGLGQMHERKGNVSLARDLFQKAYDLNPEDIRYLNILCSTQIQLGELQKAAGLIEKSRELDDASPELYLNVGNLAAAQGNFPQAQAQFDKARSLRTKTWPALALSTGICWIKAGDPEKGRSYVQESLKYRDTQARACYYMGVLDIPVNKAESVAYLKRAISLEAPLADMAGTDPLWEPMRGDPAFLQVARGNTPHGESPAPVMDSSLEPTPVPVLTGSPSGSEGTIETPSVVATAGADAGSISDQTIVPTLTPIQAVTGKPKKSKIKKQKMILTLTPVPEKKGMFDWLKVKPSPTLTQVVSKTKK